MRYRLLATITACTLAVTAAVGADPSVGLLATKDPTSGVVLVDTVLATGGEAAGTGMVLTPTGEVLTNNHVVEGSTHVRVTVPSTSAVYTATVVGVDTTHDVALLQLQDASGLPTVTLDHDGGAQVGDRVTAVGNANGGGVITEADGRVTALGADVQVSDGAAVRSLSGMIETDAGAVPGDSGGPLLDAEGEVVGMTTAGGGQLTARPRQVPAGPRQTTTAVSYAVPIASALAIVDQIRAGDETGTVRVGPSGYLGVSATDATAGVGVVGVGSGGAAADAGVTAGSLITAVGGRRVTSTDDLAAVLGETEPGEQLELTWTDADGTGHTATVTLGTSPVNA